MSTLRQPKGTPKGGQFTEGTHDEASSMLVPDGSPVDHDDDDREYHEAIRAMNRAAMNGDEEAVRQRRELIEHSRDYRGYESIGFETVHVPREVTERQALQELNADFAEARRNGALDPDYVYGAELVGSEVRVHMRPLTRRKPLRTHFANQSWMRLEGRVNSYRRNGAKVSLVSGKPWLVI